MISVALGKRETAAVRIVIEHFGDAAPGTKCSAVFLDKHRIAREKEFYAKLYSESGVHDLEILREMIAATSDSRNDHGCERSSRCRGLSHSIAESALREASELILVNCIALIPGRRVIAGQRESCRF
ncbi:hypothetical protein LF1_51660 [Rubripirellula obstinata]|uniref:Uncharacterized protein n=1 Tax=Rubripirellula obstinata TaxID=406547 RepID=A0A5B1CRT8_9BACT|nr:hypothetical protein LF1_51660 [Rubripirellula obstinata]